MKYRCFAALALAMLLPGCAAAPDLTPVWQRDLPASGVHIELSNAALAAATGQIPYVLCYPEGKYSHLTMDVAKDYYTFALRMDGWTYQTGMDPYQVPRSFVSRRITLPDYLWFLTPSGKAS